MSARLRTSRNDGSRTMKHLVPREIWPLLPTTLISTSGTGDSRTSFMPSCDRAIGTGYPATFASLGCGSRALQNRLFTVRMTVPFSAQRVQNLQERRTTMKRTVFGVLLAACVLPWATAPAAAHHSFAAEFDASTPVTLT